jgi:hypothetical protein
MTFNKDRVFTSLNADELRAGDKVIVAYNLYGLKEQVKMFTESAIDVIEVIQDEDYFNRFKIKHGESFPLAYLVERKENCTNCGAIYTCAFQVREHPELEKCKNWKPKTEQKAYEYDVPIKGQINEDGVIVERQVGECHVKFKPYTEEAKKAYENVMTKAEKHYRPFRDTDELIKVWCEKGGKWQKRELTMPHIWIRQKNCSKGELLITYFGEDEVRTDMGFMTMSKLLSDYTFTDGSPCGVEE